VEGIQSIMYLRSTAIFSRLRLVYEFVPSIDVFLPTVAYIVIVVSFFVFTTISLYDTLCLLLVLYCQQ
jgi:hypothetical protein